MAVFCSRLSKLCSFSTNLQNLRMTKIPGGGMSPDLPSAAVCTLARTYRTTSNLVATTAVMEGFLKSTTDSISSYLLHLIYSVHQYGISNVRSLGIIFNAYDYCSSS